MRNNCWLVAGGWWLTLLGLTFYSYSQIDLNLTLSSNKFYQIFQQRMIQLGYFNRPLSALIYFILIFLLFTFYFLLFKAVKERKIGLKQIFVLISGSVWILLFSYPAFSHDIFNYIFDARILIHYQNNPWTHTALNYPQDPWVRFMHWTHRTYPYGPFWLMVSLVPYVLGLGKFLLTLFNFKLFFSLAFLGSSYLIYRIVSLHDKKRALLAVTFFAFNPLILIESLVSPHLDIFMTFLGLLSIFIFIKGKKILGIFSLTVSVLTKYATAGYLPMFINRINWPKRLSWAIILTTGTILGQIYIREILPWYFIPLMAVISLTHNKFFKFAGLGFTAGGSVYYLPYLYFGDYSLMVKTCRLYFFFIPLAISLIIWFFNRRNEKK